MPQGNVKRQTRRPSDIGKSYGHGSLNLFKKRYKCRGKRNILKINLCASLGVYRELAEYRPLRGRMNAKPPIHENFPNEPHRMQHLLHATLLSHWLNPRTLRSAQGHRISDGLFGKSDVQRSVCVQHSQKTTIYLNSTRHKDKCAFIRVFSFHRKELDFAIWQKARGQCPRKLREKKRY